MWVIRNICKGICADICCCCCWRQEFRLVTVVAIIVAAIVGCQNLNILDDFLLLDCRTKTRRGFDCFDDFLLRSAAASWKRNKILYKNCIPKIYFIRRFKFSVDSLTSSNSWAWILNNSSVLNFWTVYNFPPFDTIFPNWTFSPVINFTFSPGVNSRLNLFWFVPCVTSFLSRLISDSFSLTSLSILMIFTSFRL